MKKITKMLKCMSVMLLSAVILFSSVVPALAVTVIDEDERLQYLYTFNNAVNGIKENKPSFKYVKAAGMNTEDDIFIGSTSAADISSEARKYLSVLVDAFFNPDKGMVKNFIAVLTETNSEYTEKSIAKGVDTTYFLPLYGKDYMSALTVDDEFTLEAEEKKDLLNSENDSLAIRFSFPEYDLENVENSSLSKVFDLPSGSINPVIIGGGNFSDSEGPISEVKFDNFKYHNAYVQAEFDSHGTLTKYIQNISYTFSMSFYDILRVFGAYTNIDLMEIGLAIANPILVNTGNPEVTARELLKENVIYIQYDIKTELYSFDWEPRFFGDIDNDGDVDAYDARTALRYSVGLEKITDSENLVYADVNFDGKITAADARSILRMSVELDPKFSEIPEGETVKIVIIGPTGSDKDENDGEGDAPSDTDEPNENPDDSQTNLPSTGEIAGEISDFVNSIFDIINTVKGDGTTNEGITALIQQIKDIIAAGRGDDVQDDNQSGFIPDNIENA